MTTKNQPISYFLENFEGPLDFLLHLVQKNELDVYGIAIKEITEQFHDYLEKTEDDPIDNGAEFISQTAFLMWLKSKMLLPKHEVPPSEEGEDIDPKFDIIHQLLDYCRFRDAGKTLSALESEQKAFFSRGQDPAMTIPKPLGIEHLSVEDLASLFKEAIKKTQHDIGQIHEETWRVSDKIAFIKRQLSAQEFLPLMELFSFSMSKIELIVIFLAILELMKMGKAKVVRDRESGAVMIVRGEEGIQHG